MQKLKVAVGVFILMCLLTATLAKTKEAGTPSFEPATVVSSVEPVYPTMAMGSGTVVLEVSIDSEGEVQDVKVISDSFGFNSSALEAIKQWKFKPAMLAGKPVPSVVPVAFSFSWPAACSRDGFIKGKLGRA
jgi:protein TonB